jgi:hypothetical protein
MLSLPTDLQHSRRAGRHARLVDREFEPSPTLVLGSALSTTLPSSRTPRVGARGRARQGGESSRPQPPAAALPVRVLDVPPAAADVRPQPARAEHARALHGATALPHRHQPMKAPGKSRSRSRTTCRLPMPICPTSSHQSVCPTRSAASSGALVLLLALLLARLAPLLVVPPQGLRPDVANLERRGCRGGRRLGAEVSVGQCGGDHVA